MGLFPVGIWHLGCNFRFHQIHHQLARILKELYDSQEAAFLSNIGSLAEPLSKDQWEIGTGQRCSAESNQNMFEASLEMFIESIC